MQGHEYDQNAPLLSGQNKIQCLEPLIIPVNNVVLRFYKNPINCDTLKDLRNN